MKSAYDRYVEVNKTWGETELVKLLNIVDEEIDNACKSGHYRVNIGDRLDDSVDCFKCRVLASKLREYGYDISYDAGTFGGTFVISWENPSVCPEIKKRV